MFVIETNSNAGIILAEILADPETYKVSFDDRSKDGKNYVAIKQNERMWTRTLPCFTLCETGYPAHIHQLHGDH